MDIRFLRAEPTMAHPRGRLLAVRGGRLHVWAPDGWDVVGGTRPEGARPISRAEAEEWCRAEGVDEAVLDTVPRPV
ncbi:hypothetical protein ACFFSW_12270 [Saccharothrix longispora]|uniref:Nudix hydrolase domain-containing protein n=1 Tax=Saccharothrix longispora TaxID=33920 RepID=A0ABU1Q4T5_9PSEU|nr:hypothetical protein [Saccharothrix longispora]MDR6597888.1 hypothetical protein [Saccharothrix longispora]